MEIKEENYFLNNHLKNDINPFLYPNCTDFSNLNSNHNIYNILNDEENSISSLNIFEEGIKTVDLQKDNNNLLYEKKDIMNQNNKNISYKQKKTFQTHKNLIFNIEKVLKLGRIKKNSKKIGKHDKYKRDNIIRRFKVFLIRNIFNYINNSFNINHKTKSLIRLKKISSIHTKTISKHDNILWLKSTIRDIFSQNLTTKIVSFDKDYNIKLIKRIYREGKEKNVINILNRTVKEFWQAYINNDINNNFIGFETLKNDIIKLRNLGEHEKYIELFTNVAKQFEEIYNEISPRDNKSRQKKIN